LEQAQAQFRAAAPGSIAADRFHARIERLVAGVGPSPEAEAPAENSKPQPGLVGHSDVQIFPSTEAVLTVPDRYQVGDIVPQKGHKYRITAIDENGQPTAADPIE
jgi:hypothetical protein